LNLTVPAVDSMMLTAQPLPAATPLIAAAEPINTLTAAPLCA
jgi:hypothetical protein